MATSEKIFTIKSGMIQPGKTESLKEKKRYLNSGKI
jgi:hypothetical protein